MKTTIAEYSFSLLKSIEKIVVIVAAGIAWINIIVLIIVELSFNNNFIKYKKY